MTILIDDNIIGAFSELFGIEHNRIIWGKLPIAKNYWVRYNEDKPGVAVHPYMAFYHTFRFHDRSKKTEYVDLIDIDDKIKQVKFIPIYLDYVVEIIGERVLDQINYVRAYMIWAGSGGTLDFTDAGLNYKFMVIPNDPEDNSDLEEEDQYGRVIRTTFTFSVDSILMEKTEHAGGLITEILSSIHLYDRDISESVKFGDIIISAP